MGEAEEKTTEKTTKPSWVKMKPAELEKIVVELAKEGKTPAQIGLTLRDKHGVPKAKLIGKKIKDILEENKIDYKTDEKIIEGQIEPLKTHIAKNKHDYTASRALTKKLWAVYRLKKQ
jgi:small subunit ribosomal protein S15